MKKTIKDVFEIAGHKIDFSAVDYSLKGLPRKLSMLLRAKTLDQIETTVYDSLREKWNGIESGSKEFVCFKEEDGVLCPKHVEAGRDIPFPCVFVLKCNLFMPGGKEIHLRIKIDETGDTYNESVYGVTYKYKVSEFFVCDEYGNSLLGFSQMPFPMDLKSLFLSLSRACGKESLTKEDEGKVAKNVYESWIKHGMLTDSERPLIKDTARHLTFETGLQTKDGRKVQVILWKDTATDDMYEFRVVMGMSSILDQNEADEFDSRSVPAKPTISLPVSREITIRGAVVVKDLALKLGIPTDRIITDLMVLKIPATIDQRIKPDEAIIVAQKYGYKVNVEHARDAANKKPMLKSINAGEDIPQDTPTYSFGPNVGGEIMAATQALDNEKDRTEPDNIPTDTTQGRIDDVGVESFAPIKKDVTDAPSQIGDRQQRENSCDDGWDGEMTFLSAFDGYVKACGFKYEPADLVRLHTSVKCSMCTLLAGSPGTGKSSLAELYMRAVAGSPEKNDAERSWRQIFVNPAWMEPADLLGYETDSVFRHAPSHLAEFIRNISEGENLPMGIVCFEEMNLACVEHYFSDFIQIMSRGMGVIPGCKENERDLFVGHNFRVIGTCNSDETTRPLSPRFLSRCNTIELSSSFETTKLLVEDIAKGNTPEIKPFSGNAPITYKDFEHWFESSYARTIDDGIVSAILSLLEPKEEDESIMSSAGFDMSGRIISDLFAYIRSRPPYTGKISDNREASRLSEVDRQKVALDEFLAQRVFFACRPTPGTITAINTLWDKVNNGFKIEVSGKDDQKVSTDLPKLPLSAELLKRRIDDYTKRIMQV